MFYQNGSQRRNWMMRKGFFFLFGLAALALLLGGLVMLLWNAILPPVTGVQPLSYWQALGLLLLCRLLFGGVPGRRPPYRGGHPWRKKWKNMSDEERARFREAWKERCRMRGRDDTSEKM